LTISTPRAPRIRRGFFFADATPAGLIAAVERYHKIKHVFEPAALRRHASCFSRAAFKSKVKQLIEARLQERARSVHQNVETA
jgi:hypothetical protein